MQDAKSTTQILIVEDDEDTRTLLEFLLKRAGFEVITAVDGEQAILKVETMPPPSLILLDVMMPFVDGFDILVQIRNQPSWKQVPVIILTAQERQQNIDRGYELGITDYIIKPFKTSELVAQILAVTGKTSA